MLVTIKSSNHVWTAPDGQMKIWDFTGVYPDTGEQLQGSTRSNRIANAIDQTLDLTTTVSKSGKTYYIQVPRDGSQGFTQAAQALPTPSPVSNTNNATERFTQAVDKFERAVDRLVGTPDVPTTENNSVPPQYQPEYFGEVENDL